jgi:tetratricopeptide (TPR) repeat protein
MPTAGQAQDTGLTPQQALAQAEQLFQAGRLGESEAVCRQILAARPRFHPAYFQLAMIAVHAGKLPLAADLTGRALTFDSSVAAYHKALGEISRRLGRIPNAIAAGRQATKLAPRDATAFYNLGLALADGGQFREAAAEYRRALALNPRYGMAANNLGTLLEKQLDDVAEAKKFYTLAIEIDPRHAEAQNNLGAILSADGDLDAARACFNAAIEGNPSFIHAHFNLSTLKKYKEDDPHLKAMEAMLPQVPSMPPETRLRFWFAIAKAWEDIGRYDEAFDAYSRGNRLKRATFKYDVNTTRASCDDIIRRFDAGFFAENKGGGYADETPVFIVGMPRSGTTLIEQIMSSHTGIFGAGELKDFCDAVSEKTGKPAGASYMELLAGHGKNCYSEIGKAYIERIRKLAPHAPRITDKMPGNFFYVGLIHLALPQAKIIWSQRDPMDTCLSNYSRLFNETMPFAYDLAELGHYHNCCRRVMEHWKKVLPAGVILDFKYEEVVEDLETQARRLIEFCGLEWQESCLDFHRNERPVKTASIAQVRTPIYKSSVAKWEHFRKHLEPLRVIIDEGEKQS